MRRKKETAAQQRWREHVAAHGKHEWLPKSKFNHPDYCPGPVIITRPNEAKKD